MNDVQKHITEGPTPCPEELAYIQALRRLCAFKSPQSLHEVREAVGTTLDAWVKVTGRSRHELSTIASQKLTVSEMNALLGRRPGKPGRNGHKG